MRLEPKRPGATKSNNDHKSNNRFSIGVPVKTKRTRLVSNLMARVCLAIGFLIAWASSNINMSHDVSLNQGRRFNVPYVVMITSTADKSGFLSSLLAEPCAIQRDKLGANRLISACQFPNKDAGNTKRCG